jgi:hypothetical protein
MRRGLRAGGAPTAVPPAGTVKHTSVAARSAAHLVSHAAHIAASSAQHTTLACGPAARARASARSRAWGGRGG